MDDSASVHVFHPLKYLLCVSHNFFLCQVVIITDLLKQLTSRNSVKMKTNQFPNLAKWGRKFFKKYQLALGCNAFQRALGCIALHCNLHWVAKRTRKRRK